MTGGRSQIERWRTGFGCASTERNVGGPELFAPAIARYRQCEPRSATRRGGYWSLEAGFDRCRRWLPEKPAV